MKVGTDGVLLGAWATVEGDCRILDVGTGSGLIALMAAQRSAEADIVAIDIDSGAARQARENVAASPWSDRIRVVMADLVSWHSDELFDHILSNPPYFADSLPSPDVQRSVARHTSKLDYEALVASAVRLLRRGGRLSVILPTDGARLFRRIAFGRMWLSRLTDVVTREGDEPRRTMMEFIVSDRPIMPRCTTLTIHDAEGCYTDEYRLLTEDFYLMF